MCPMRLRGGGKGRLERRRGKRVSRGKVGVEFLFEGGQRGEGQLYCG